MAARRSARLLLAAAVLALARPGPGAAAPPAGDVARVADRIAAELRAAGLAVAPGAGDELVVSAAGTELARLRVRDEGRPEDEGKAHFHVLTHLAGAPDGGLDACLFGLGDTREEALDAAARAYTVRVFPPLAGMVREEASTTALRFGGTEPWAVPGFRGLAGPSVSWTKDVDDRTLERAVLQGQVFAGLSARRW